MVSGRFTLFLSSVWGRKQANVELQVLRWNVHTLFHVSDGGGGTDAIRQTTAKSNASWKCSQKIARIPISLSLFSIPFIHAPNLSGSGLIVSNFRIHGLEMPIADPLHIETIGVQQIEIMIHAARYALTISRCIVIPFHWCECVDGNGW